MRPGTCVRASSGPHPTTERALQSATVSLRTVYRPIDERTGKVPRTGGNVVREGHGSRARHSTQRTSPSSDFEDATQRAQRPRPQLRHGVGAAAEVSGRSQSMQVVVDGALRGVAFVVVRTEETEPPYTRASNSESSSESSRNEYRADGWGPVRAGLVARSTTGEEGGVEGIRAAFSLAFVIGGRAGEGVISEGDPSHHTGADWDWAELRSGRCRSLVSASQSAFGTETHSSDDFGTGSASGWRKVE